MSTDELISELKRMRENAIHGEVNAMLVLFGVKYANELSDSEISIDEVSQRALKRSGAYVRAGIHLSKYVEVKQN